MKKLTSVAIGLTLVSSALGQCNMTAIERQQHQLSRQVEILHGNFLTFWIDAYPKGAPFPTRDGAAERRAAWTPEYRKQEGVVTLNDGLGCVAFMKPNSPDKIPSLCAPVDLQAHLAMEALREDWENTRNVDKNSMLNSIHESIPMVWAEEKTLYCVLRPDAQYIGLNDSLENCTPKT